MNSVKTLHAARPVALSLVETLVGGVFLIAGIAKLLDLQAFHDSLVNLPMLGGTAAGLVTILIPNVEATLGICFILGHHTGMLRAAACALALSFALLALYWVGHGMKTGCACLGKIKTPPERALWIFARDVALALMTAYIYYGRRGQDRRLESSRSSESLP
jgi:uncharacterized membrane protein YphA (DoxX/SURF4 family)